MFRFFLQLQFYSTPLLKFEHSFNVIPTIVILYHKKSQSLTDSSGSKYYALSYASVVPHECKRHAIRAHIRINLNTVFNRRCYKFFAKVTASNTE